MNDEKIHSFQEFWPFYLGEHRDPANRRLHYAGTFLVILAFGVAVITERYLIMLAMPFLGYGFAWIGHFIIEKNRPATFTYPAWSLAADFKMFYYAITGRISDEMVRYYGAVHPTKQTPRIKTQ